MKVAIRKCGYHSNGTLLYIEKLKFSYQTNDLEKNTLY